MASVEETNDLFDSFCEAVSEDDIDSQKQSFIDVDILKKHIQLSAYGIATSYDPAVWEAIFKPNNGVIDDETMDLMKSLKKFNKRLFLMIDQDLADD